MGIKRRKEKEQEIEEQEPEADNLRERGREKVRGRENSPEKALAGYRIKSATLSWHPST